MPSRREGSPMILLEGEHGSDYAPPPCREISTDVSSPDWIEQSKAEGVTGGCGGGTTYCPSASNTRGQMATFLVKTFRLS